MRITKEDIKQAIPTMVSKLLEKGYQLRKDAFFYAVSCPVLLSEEDLEELWQYALEVEKKMKEGG